MTMNKLRPLSPHLQVYKLPLTGIVSITHRMTGVMLSVGLIFFVTIVSAVSGGQETYTAMQEVMEIWLFRLVYWGFIYALFFHLCHGVRHLIWDSGESFDLETMDQFAVYELGASFVLTVVTFIIF